MSPDDVAIPPGSRLTHNLIRRALNINSLICLDVEDIQRSCADVIGAELRYDAEGAELDYRLRDGSRERAMRLEGAAVGNPTCPACESAGSCASTWRVALEPGATIADLWFELRCGCGVAEGFHARVASEASE